MYLLELRAKIENNKLIHGLPVWFNLERYQTTSTYSAKTWFLVLTQRAILFNSILTFNEIDFTNWIESFDVKSTTLGLSLDFKSDEFITTSLDSPIITRWADHTRPSFKELKNVNEIEAALNSRLNSVLCINRHANPDVLIKELSKFIKSESLWCKSINKVSGKRIRGFYGPDKTYERINHTRFKRIINEHKFSEIINYEVLAYIDLTLYALLCQKKYGNKYMDTLLFPESNEGNIQTRKVEKVTQHLANAVLMKSFLSELYTSL